MVDTREDIRRFIVDTFLFGAGEDLRDSDSFLEKGILDSTGVMELVAHLESAHGIKVQDAELLPDNLDSIDAVVAFVARKRVAD